MKAAFILFGVILCLAGCKKNDQAPPANQFVEYLIEKGSHYCNNSPYKPVELSEMKFIVKFDSSAIYQTALQGNQFDINKLFGFSDNDAEHHEYSARIGWCWTDNSLRLFAYVYNAGIMTSKEIGSYLVDTEIKCSIQPIGSNYVFTAGDKTIELSRLSTTSKARGYQLYPYFGGDETAPHVIRILIKNLE